MDGRTTMFLLGFRRRTGMSAPELVALFRSIIHEGRQVHPVAGDFLEHFMDGAGAPRRMSLRWLRSFRAIQRAERKNQRRLSSSSYGRRGV